MGQRYTYWGEQAGWGRGISSDQKPNGHYNTRISMYTPLDRSWHFWPVSNIYEVKFYYFHIFPNKRIIKSIYLFPTYFPSIRWEQIHSGMFSFDFIHLRKQLNWHYFYFILFFNFFFILQTASILFVCYIHQLSDV